MGVQPVADEEVIVEMLVRVPAYGHPDRLCAQIEAATRKALRNTFGDKFTVLTAPFGSHYDSDTTPNAPLP